MISLKESSQPKQSKIKTILKVIAWVASSGVFGTIGSKLFKLSGALRNLPDNSIILISIIIAGIIAGLFLLIGWSINKICNTIHNNKQSDNLKEIITAISDKPDGVGYDVEFEITQDKTTRLKVTRINNKKEDNDKVIDLISVKRNRK